MSYIADDIVCQAPAGRLDGAQAFREFMGPFSQIVTRSELIAAFGDVNVAVLMYETGTVPVQRRARRRAPHRGRRQDQPAADHLRPAALRGRATSCCREVVLGSPGRREDPPSAGCAFTVGCMAGIPSNRPQCALLDQRSRRSSSARREDRIFSAEVAYRPAPFAVSVFTSSAVSARSNTLASSTVPLR